MKLQLPSIRKINKTWAILGVALGIGVIAALATRSYLSKQIARIEAQGQHATVDLVVAKTEIDKGGMLSRANVAVRKIPVEFAHSGAVKPADFDRIEGRAIAYGVKGGELIMWSAMEHPRPATFSARLVPGQRAITVVVDEINSISGMLEPGDFIDLMFTADRQGRKAVFPLLQSVQVLATGQRAVNDPKSGERLQFATVTLNATPSQAKNIIVARESGKLTALLRNPEDKLPLGEKSVDLSILFGPQRASAPGTRHEIPVLYGASAAKLPPGALKLGRYRTAADAPAEPPDASTPPAPVLAAASRSP